MRTFSANVRGLTQFRRDVIDQLRLRSKGASPPFHIALLHPEIPQNTGNIARLAAATGSFLHLVGKLGFRIDEKAVRRAGLDYWHLVKLRMHPSLDALAAEVPPGRWHLLSARASRSVFDVDLRAGDLFLFGCESRGLPDDVLAQHHERVVGIPTSGAVRSLNLANAVAIVLFEAIRRVGGLAEPFLA